jgi:hypothetical protein
MFSSHGVPVLSCVMIWLPALSTSGMLSGGTWSIASA